MDPGIAHPHTAEGRRVTRIRRVGYGVMSAALAALLTVALADIRNPVLGVDTAERSQRLDDGGELVVTYTELTRPALASPLAIELTRPGGFDEPIELAVSRPWIEVWDENGFYPSADAETGDPDWVLYTFDPPPGPTLRVFYDARLEPGRQDGVSGAVQVRDGERVLAEVPIETRVLP